jgi:hypothetical protein
MLRPYKGGAGRGREKRGGKQILRFAQDDSTLVGELLKEREERFLLAKAARRGSGLAALEMTVRVDGLAGPDAGGEGFDGVEAEFFVELDGGVVFGGDGQG